MTDDLLYVLDGNGAPVAMPNDRMGEWSVWMGAHQEDRLVARTVIGPYLVSTIFLGIALGKPGEPPKLWESGVRNTAADGKYTEIQRYGSRAEALAGHEQMVRRVTQSLAYR